ncbi:MAG: hypothetical protein EA423_08260 [Phycisphaerales bacterium]|nr:MAG: hypothetical protein EA423_08260 [Phycisphaerales bacterium]
MTEQPQKLARRERPDRARQPGRGRDDRARCTGQVGGLCRNDAGDKCRVFSGLFSLPRLRRRLVFALAGSHFTSQRLAGDCQVRISQGRSPDLEADAALHQQPRGLLDRFIAPHNDASIR